MFQIPEAKNANSVIATKATPGKKKAASKSQVAKNSAKVSRKTRDALKHLELLPVRGPDSKLISTYNTFLLAWQEYLIDAETNPKADVTIADEIACKIVEMPAYTPEGMLLKLNAAASVIGETKTEFPWGGKDFQWDTRNLSTTAQIEYTLISKLRDDIRRSRPAATDANLTEIAAVAVPTNEEATFDRIRRHQFLGEQIADLTEAEDRVAAAARHVYGKQPFPLIRWRNYSHIGGNEIERVRSEFLALGIPADVVKKEYLDAKRRYKERKSECLRWEKRLVTQSQPARPKADEQVSATIRLTDNLAGWLDEWDADAPLLWNSQPIATMKKTFKRHALDCGFDRFTQDTIRHFMATQIRRSKPPVSQEQRDAWLGHNKKRTANWYEHNDPEFLHDAKVATDAILAKLQKHCRRPIFSCKSRAKAKLVLINGGRKVTRSA